MSKLDPDQVLGRLRPTAAVERTATSVAGVRWMPMVVDAAGEERAMITIAADAHQYGPLVERVKRSGLVAVRHRDWERMNLDPSDVLMIVRDGCLTELSAEYRRRAPGGFQNARARLAPNPPLPVTPRWMDAALARRPILAVLPFETFGMDPGQEWDDTAIDAEMWDQAAVAASLSRELWAGYAIADLGIR